MIRFLAKLYNESSAEYIDNSFKYYTIAQYIASWSEYDNPFINHEGQTLTTIPITAFEGDTSNIGRAIEYYAKQYYNDNAAWPRLKILTSDSTTDYYILWTHDNPTSLQIKASTTVISWESVLQWDDYIDTSGETPRFDTLQSYVFVTAGSSQELTELVFGGAYCLTSSPMETLIAYNGYTITYPEDAYTNVPLKPLGKFGTKTCSKYNNSKPTLVFAWQTESTCCLFTVVPTAIGSTQDMPPWDRRISYNATLTNRLGVSYEGAAINAQGFNKLSGGNELYFAHVVPYREGGITDANIISVLSESGVTIAFAKNILKDYLNPPTPPTPPTPSPDPSDVDPDNIPDPDEPPTPQPPDNPDPYYDPTSDPDSPDYDPTKDPSSPDYDPDVPHPPFTPPSTEGGGDTPQPQPPQDEIPAPETPPSYVTTNALFTLYNPAAADLTNLANFLWSPAWSIDTFKKIFANPLDCILGLMVMPYLAVDVGTKNMNVGNIDTGVAMRYFTKQFYDFDCGDFTIEEFYRAYLDYAPYTKISIFLPYIGDQQLNTDEVMGKTLNVKYRFDLATGDCVAFVSVDGSVLYSFSGNCAARLPLSSNNYGGLLPSITGAIVAAGSVAAGVPALGAASALAVSSMKQDIKHTGSISGSAGLMGVQTPYLIITRPRQALPIGQNSFMGYPSFITESLGGLTGYTEVESCHLEHVPCTDEELREIENLLKGGVLF